ncbi:indolepyruvate ferredoxin oxidoreductase subunit alpha [Candidatus Falkowbacteria bacterium]|nr:indolepyruvate ferredoxin oxidoreductase subunit alpha [Candidatus Falkowbacteria bacterium]
MNKEKILKPKGKSFLMGDEAIVRGALEAGVGFVSTYPGTPATEIGDTFSALAKDAGIYFEYSANEKIAMEAIIGASLCSIRGLVAFKHFGLNVACDSLLPAAYIEARAGLVIVVSDDPSGWSSIQSEQDSRHFATMANIPIIEPADQQEAKDLIKYAFEISEKFKTPVLFRITTRVAHVSAPVELKPFPKPTLKGDFQKDIKKFNAFKPRITEMHNQLLQKIETLRKEFVDSKANFIVNNKKNSTGIICSGVSFLHVMEILEKNKLTIPVLKLGTIYPLPTKLIIDFLKNKERVLIVEELDPFVENQVAIIAQTNKLQIEIFGKNIIPQSGELTPAIIENAMTAAFNIKMVARNVTLSPSKGDIPRRFPVFCPGCPHRATFYSIKQIVPDAIFGGDIGCYMMGIFPPYFTQDFQYAMGAGLGISHGINKILQLNKSDKKNIAFVGDATFFHAGIPALINAIHNKANLLLVIMDNSITAMTGLQPNPGTDKTGMGEPTSKTSIEELVKACGANSLEISDAYNLKQTQAAIKTQLEKPGVNVLLVRRKCALLMLKESRQQGIKRPTFQVDQKECEHCGTCYTKFSCPAIKHENGITEIDQTMCVGCGVCAQICSAIKINKK